MIRATRIGAAMLLGLSLAACQSRQEKPVIMSSKPAVALRAIQTRVFDTPDRGRMLRAVVATLQDLDYTLNKVEPKAGTISATKAAMLHMTATVYPRGTTQMVVRANAMIDLPSDNNQIDAPEFYQQMFFEPLSKAVFLQALQVEDPGEPPASAPSGPADAARNSVTDSRERNQQ